MDETDGAGGGPPPLLVRAQLETILASRQFRPAGRLSRFLRFTVEHALQDGAAPAKEYLVGVEVFDRPESFDPRTDSVVRVEARRLRQRLEAYYETDGREDPIVIALPKGGYAPVFRQRTRADAPKAGAAPWRRRALWVAAPAVALGLGLLIQLGQSRAERRKVERTVAVLPFDNLSAKPEDEYFSHGLVEELTTELARIKELRVVARSSAARVKKGERVSEIGRQLQAGLVVEGSVRRDKDRVRIAVRLLNASGESHLWSHSYERGEGGSLGIQQEIAGAMAKVLRLQIDPPPETRTSTPSALRAEARDLYWKGRYVRKQAGEEGPVRSVDLYRQALGKDPNHALAHAAIAEAYGTMAFHSIGPPGDWIEKARQAAGEAIRLDATLAEPQALLAWISFFSDGDWAEAERGFRRALALDPSCLKAHAWYALGLIARGRVQEAIAESRIAQELDPLAYAAASDPGVILYCARRYDEAIRWAGKSLASDPEFRAARMLLAMSYAAQRRLDEAIGEYRKAVAGGPRYSYMLGRLGHALGARGQRAEAMELIAEIKREGSGEGAYHTHVAMIHAGVGDGAQALDELEKALQRREGDVNFLLVEAAFDSLRGLPRFQALLRRAGLVKP